MASAVLRNLSNDEVHEHDINSVQEQIHDVIARRTESAPVVIQTVGEEQKLAPTKAEASDVAEGVDVEQVRILHDDLLIVENEAAVQAIPVDDHSQSDERRNPNQSCWNPCRPWVCGRFRA